MATWTGNHKMQPSTCAGNATAWGETITAYPQPDVVVKVDHIDKLRSAINRELRRRELPEWTWAQDPVIHGDVTKIRKAHVDELRDQLIRIHNGDCPSDGLYHHQQNPPVCIETATCTSESANCGSDSEWETITVDPNPEVKIKASHWNGMRNALNTLETTCICESDDCNYCADCGHYSYIPRCLQANACDCRDHCGGEGDCEICTSVTPASYTRNCGSINSATPLPYKTWPGGVPHDEYVPWPIGGPALGNTWGSWNPTWSCKCNPFAWA